MSEGRNTELVSELRDRLDKRRAALKDEVARGWTDKFENAADWATLTVPFNELAAVFDALESTSRALSEKEEALKASEERGERLRKALEPFARIADMEERSEAGASVMVNVSRCREARTTLADATKKDPGTEQREAGV